MPRAKRVVAPSAPSEARLSASSPVTKQVLMDHEAIGVRLKEITESFLAYLEEMNGLQVTLMGLLAQAHAAAGGSGVNGQPPVVDFYTMRTKELKQYVEEHGVCDRNGVLLDLDDYDDLDAKREAVMGGYGNRTPTPQATATNTPVYPSQASLPQDIDDDGGDNEVNFMTMSLSELKLVIKTSDLGVDLSAYRGLDQQREAVEEAYLKQQGEERLDNAIPPGSAANSPGVSMSANW
jgi:hypothetical protein